MRASQPPRLATRLLTRLASGDKRESLIGDLVEQYQSGRSASWYWRQTITSILTGAGQGIRDHKLLALRACAVGMASLWVFWLKASVLLRLVWVLSNGGLSVAGHSITLDYRWTHYRIYLVSLLAVAGAAASGWIVARLHREHQTAMVLAFLTASLLASGLQIAAQVRLLGWPIRPLAQSTLAFALLFIAAPTGILIGGLWTDYGTSTTGARQNATF